MTAETKIRNKILRRIQQIPLSRLNELDDFVSKIELSLPDNKQVTSYAGVWESLPNEIVSDFTDNLLSNRQRNQRRDE